MVYTNEEHWHAVHIRSRHEKKVCHDLCRRDVETFLPLVTVPSSRRDRRAEYDKPLFPGYLFVQISRDRAWDVIDTKGVVRILGPRSWEYSVVPEQQIESVRTLVESKVKLDPFAELKVGRVVRIKRGLLRGVEGQLIERRGRARIVVAVDLLGKAVTADIDADDAEAI